MLTKYRLCASYQIILTSNFRNLNITEKNKIARIKRIERYQVQNRSDFTSLVTKKKHRRVLRKLNDYISEEEREASKINITDIVQSTLILLAQKKITLEQILQDEEASMLIRIISKEVLFSGDEMLKLVLEKALSRNLQIDLTSAGLPLNSILNEIERKQIAERTILEAQAIKLEQDIKPTK